MHSASSTSSFISVPTTLAGLLSSTSSSSLSSISSTTSYSFSTNAVQSCSPAPAESHTQQHTTASGNSIVSNILPLQNHTPSLLQQLITTATTSSSPSSSSSTSCVSASSTLSSAVSSSALASASASMLAANYYPTASFTHNLNSHSSHPHANVFTQQHSGVGSGSGPVPVTLSTNPQSMNVHGHLGHHGGHAFAAANMHVQTHSAVGGGGSYQIHSHSHNQTSNASNSGLTHSPSTSSMAAFAAQQLVNSSNSPPVSVALPMSMGMGLGVGMGMGMPFLHCCANCRQSLVRACVMPCCQSLLCEACAQPSSFSLDTFKSVTVCALCKKAVSSQSITVQQVSSTSVANVNGGGTAAVALLEELDELRDAFQSASYPVANPSVSHAQQAAINANFPAKLHTLSSRFLTSSPGLSLPHNYSRSRLTRSQSPNALSSSSTNSSLIHSLTLSPSRESSPASPTLSSGHSSPTPLSAKQQSVVFASGSGSGNNNTAAAQTANSLGSATQLNVNVNVSVNGALGGGAGVATDEEKEAALAIEAMLDISAAANSSAHSAALTASAAGSRRSSPMPTPDKYEAKLATLNAIRAASPSVNVATNHSHAFPANSSSHPLLASTAHSAVRPLTLLADEHMNNIMLHAHTQAQAQQQPVSPSNYDVHTKLMLMSGNAHVGMALPGHMAMTMPATLPNTGSQIDNTQKAKKRKVSPHEDRVMLPTSASLSAAATFDQTSGLLPTFPMAYQDDSDINAALMNQLLSNAHSQQARECANKLSSLSPTPSANSTSLAAFSAAASAASASAAALQPISVVKSNGQRAYLCPIGKCSKPFPKPSAVYRHIRTHTGEKPFICPYCSLGFAERGNLKRHTMIHEGVKPFACTLCSAQFARRCHLLHHRKSKHAITEDTKKSKSAKKSNIANGNGSDSGNDGMDDADAESESEADEGSDDEMESSERENRMLEDENKTNKRKLSELNETANSETTPLAHLN